MTADEENQIALYWSGELEPGEAAAAEALLAGNSEAARFLAELKRQAELARSAPDAEAPPRPLAAAAADTVANEIAASKVIRFPRFQVIAAVAAAIAVLAIAAIFLRDQLGPDCDPGLASELGRREAIAREVDALEAAVADFQLTAGFAGRRT